MHTRLRRPPAVTAVTAVIAVTAVTTVIAVTAVIAPAISPAHASAAVRCTPHRQAATQLFLEIPCAADADITPDLTPTCESADTVAAARTRLPRGTDLPLTRCARRVAWVLALFGQIMRPHWQAPDYTWTTHAFDHLVQRARLGDVPYADLTPELRQAFIDAVHGALRPNDGPVPYVTITPASDPRMRQPISAVATLDLAAATARFLDPVLDENPRLSYGPAPQVRMDVDSPASIGVYGWDIRARWPAPEPPLRWRTTPQGTGWQTDGWHAFTRHLIDVGTTGAALTDTAQASLREIVEVLDTWQLVPFTPYRDGSLPESIRLLAATARQSITSVREAARAPSAPNPVRNVFVVIRLTGGIEAVLHGSIGRFAPGVAEIHAIATPVRNIFPRLPLSPVIYRRDAVRGATAYAIHSFVRHAQNRGATMLLHIGQDLPAAPWVSPTPPHGEL